MGVFIVASLGLSMLLYGKLTTQGLGVLDAWLANARPWFTTVRWTLLAVLIGFWPQWIKCLAEHGYLDQVQSRRAQAMRWRAAIWLIGLDLLFAERLWQRFGNSLTILLDR